MKIVASRWRSERRTGKLLLQRIPHTLPPVPWTKLSLLGNESLFFLVNLAFARDKVNLVEGYDFGFEQYFVASPEDDEGRDGDIGGNKCIGLEGDEGVITLEESDNGGGGEGKV